MKSTDKLPWGVPVVFFGFVLLWLVYVFTHSRWMIVVGVIFAAFAGDYFRRVFKGLGG